MTSPSAAMLPPHGTVQASLPTPSGASEQHQQQQQQHQHQQPNSGKQQRKIESFFKAPASSEGRHSCGCMHVCVCVRACVRVCVCMCVHASACKSLWQHVELLQVHMLPQTQACTCVRTHTHTHTRTHTHTHAHAHTHARTHTHTCRWWQGPSRQQQRGGRRREGCGG
jgi:hypothetical protein